MATNTAVLNEYTLSLQPPTAIAVKSQGDRLGNPKPLAKAETVGDEEKHKKAEGEGG